MNHSFTPDELRSIVDNLERRIQSQLAELTRRIYRIETHLGIAHEVLNRPTLPLQASEEWISTIQRPAETGRLEEPVHPEHTREVEASVAATPEAKTPPAPSLHVDWETLIGGKWALWVGSLAVFLAAAFFLAYTWQYFTPNARLGLGFLGGVLFVIAGEFFRLRDIGNAQNWFGEGLEGTGLGLLYLTIWAGAHVYPILSPQIAFICFLFITLAGVLLALNHDSQGLSILATVGGFLTPVLLAAKSPGEVLVYVALLDIGILVISLFKRWQSLTWLSFIGTVLLFSPTGFSPPFSGGEKALYFSFFTFYYFIFLGASSFYSLFRLEKTRDEDLALLFADTSLYSAGVYALHIQSRFPAGFPILLSIFYFSFAFFVHRRAEKNLLLKSTLMGIAVFFLTIAIPIQLQRGEIAVGWSIEAAVLVTLGARFKNLIFQQEGWVVWGLSLLAAAASSILLDATPHLLFVNAQALPLLFAFAATAWMAFFTNSKSADPASPAYAAFAVILGAWLLALETYTGFQWGKIPSTATWQGAALDAIAIFWVLYAFLFIFAGLSFKNEVARVTAEIMLPLCLFPPLLVTLTQNTDEWLPFFNLRFLAYLIVAGGIWFAAKLRRGEPGAEITLAAEAKQIQDVSTMIVVLTLLGGLTQETYLTFSFYHELLGPHWERMAQMGISLVCVCFGSILLLGGIFFRYQLLRLLSLGILGMTVLKVFLFDLQFLPTPYRVLSFGGLGAALIGISWLYSHFGKSIVGEQD